MKYFFLSLFAVCLVVVGVQGFRGQKFSQNPFEVFPDMDRQDKLKAQKPDAFFADGMGSRLPVLGTVPRNADSGVMPIEFGAGRSGYYFDGKIDGTYGNGMPDDLKLETEADRLGLLNRGQEMFGVNCAICHGVSGDGKGVVAKYLAKASTPVTVSNLHNFPQETFPDGYIYHVITDGKKLMGSYKHNIPVRDRWAIVAYLRALQASAK